MGNRRFSRKRLYEIEKRGQTVDLESGLGIEPAIGPTTQHRQGNELITEIVVDLGSTRGTIIGGGADKPVGVAALPAQITRLTQAKYGRLVETRIICLEDAGQDFDLVVGDSVENTTDVVNGRVELAAAIGNDVGEDITNIGVQAITGIDSNGMQDSGNEWYLYLTNANGNSNTTDINAGKFLIYLHGFVAPDDLA